MDGACQLRLHVVDHRVGRIVFRRAPDPTLDCPTTLRQIVQEGGVPGINVLKTRTPPCVEETVGVYVERSTLPGGGEIRVTLRLAGRLQTIQ